jgi:G3E family GTPase
MQPHLILVGGFLGAGKTTLLLAAAQRLAARGLRVGLVMNDQGAQLVDTALAQDQAIPVVEVAGGCFCCRFPDLTLALHQLRTSVNPDVILAEPVGSCTDLLATVVRPLLAYHPEEFTIAPLTVLVDPQRRPTDYSDEIDYLYRQQLTEAEILLVNKQDLLPATTLAERLHTLTTIYAPTPVFAASAQTGAGVDEWLAHVLDQISMARQELAIDYGRYAEAEAQLGWLNAHGVVESQASFQPRNWLTHLLHLLNAAFAGQRAAVAHLKLHATTPAGVAKASLTETGGPLYWDALPPTEPATRLEFLLNARVHTTPAMLEATVRQAFAEMTPSPDFRYAFWEFACFSPAPPTPTHRLAGSQNEGEPVPAPS